MAGKKQHGDDVAASAAGLVEEARRESTVFAAAPKPAGDAETAKARRFAAGRRAYWERIIRVARLMPAPGGIQVLDEAKRTVAALDAFLEMAARK